MQTDALIGVQDMGAAGLTCSTCEMGARGGTGIEIDVSRVPQRETGHDAVRDHALRIAGAHAARRQEGPRGRSRGDLREMGPARGAHRRGHDRRRAARQGSRRGRRRDSEHARSSTKRRSTTARRRGPPTSTRARDWTTAGIVGGGRRRRRMRSSRLLASPTVASKRWVYRQYDHMVRTNTLVLAGMGAGVVRVKGTDRALAMSTDGNGRYCYLDPRRGAMLAVAEAARNVACAGGAADRRHQLPELRQSRAPRDHVAARRGHRGHGRRLPRARHSDHRRQRQPLQRNRRPGDLSDARHRRRRPDRGRHRSRCREPSSRPATKWSCSARVSASSVAAST